MVSFSRSFNNSFDGYFPKQSFLILWANDLVMLWQSSYVLLKQRAISESDLVFNSKQHDNSKSLATFNYSSVIYKLVSFTAHMSPFYVLTSL